MKVVSGQTMQHCDRRAIEEFGVPGLVLMENAGRASAAAIAETFADLPGRRAVVVAGKGNNGGDGYVVARYLREWGWEAPVLVVAAPEDVGGDALVNLARLDDSGVIFCPGPGGLARHAGELAGATVLVDALLGTGLQSEVRGAMREAIALLNRSNRPVAAVDIPSGIDAGSGRVLGEAVRAQLTVTFGLAKLGHILYPGAEYVGELRLAEIGIPAEVLAAAPGVEFVNAPAAATMIRRRGRSDHKGSFGHCLVVAGSSGKTGAAAMAANSAVRSGAGLVTLAAPASLNSVLEIKTTEAMTLPLPEEGPGFLSEAAWDALQEALAGKDALAVGPGVSRHPAAATLVRRLVASADLPTVVDADGLNALSEAPAAMSRQSSAPLILTPHPGEMARLAATTVADVEADRLAVAQEYAASRGVYLVLKGAHTVIAAPDGRLAVNGSGNPGMASGGMGDVLTGVLAALLGQGYEPFAACSLGVFIHGHAADLVARAKGETGMNATDVQEMLPFAFKELTD